jgi:hypothetical protein
MKMNKRYLFLAILAFFILSLSFTACKDDAIFERYEGPVSDLMVKFGVKKKGHGLNQISIADVTETFYRLHEYLQSIQSSPGMLNGEDSLVQLGDYIDLSELTVQGYPVNDGDRWTGNGKISISQNNFLLDENQFCGTTLRLIVVGRNSFNAMFSTNTNYNVTSNNSGGAHVVFQFQNIPGLHRMNGTDTTVGGYAQSEMRKYLVPIHGDNASGQFLAGLIAAGVPENILWAPTRYIANQSGSNATVADEIIDKIWLPSEREVKQQSLVSNATYENAQNQSRLEYYYSLPYYGSLSKYIDTDDNNGYMYQEWWLASPLSYFGSFCSTGAYRPPVASTPQGVAPAFCVH